jgi:Phage portal protein, SPP1 Gp6-like
MADQPIDFSTAPANSPEWWLQRLEARLLARQQPMALFDDYYRGNHRLSYHSARMLGAFGQTFRELRVNYCGVVVDALAERLDVNGFRFAEDQRAADAAWGIWHDSGLESLFDRGLRSGLTKGEAALLVWVNADGSPRIWAEDGSQTIVASDPADPANRRAALKRWFDPDARRLFATVYLPGGLYKYQTPPNTSDDPIASQGGSLPTPGWNRGGGATGQGASGTGPGTTLPATGASATRWLRRVTDGEPWPLPNPLGVVPVIPLPTKPDLHGIGESELRVIIPIQDAINANIVNVMLAGQFAAFRQRWATNVKLEVDAATGKPVQPWNIAIDTLLTTPPPEPGEPATQFGSFDATELDGYIALHGAYVQALATISRTPPHYFIASMGNFPSGESLRSAEAGLKSKAQERINDDKGPVADAMRLAFLVASKQDGITSGVAARYARWAAMTEAESLWADPETKTESEHVDALVKLSAGLAIPPEALWPRIPASPQEIERWQTMKIEKAALEAAAPAPQLSAGDSNSPAALAAAAAAAAVSASTSPTPATPAPIVNGAAVPSA